MSRVETGYTRHSLKEGLVMDRRYFLCLLAMASAPFGPQPAFALPLAKLDRAARKARAAIVDGRIGAAVRDLDTGLTWSHDGGAPYPMQSVYKAPIAAAALRLVETGRVKLDQPIAITTEDLSIHYSPIASAFRSPNQTYTFRQLIEYAVAQSDNTASDLILRMAGGGAAVNGLLASKGIVGMSVDRPEEVMQLEALGLPPRADWPQNASLDDMLGRMTKAARRKALRAYLADPRDTTTAIAAVDFLEQLEGRKLLSAPMSEVLLGAMLTSATGTNRLKAGMPRAAKLAHKTGTARSVLGVSPATNDIGLAYLPDGRRLAIAVFVSGTSSSLKQREAAIASIAAAATG